MNWEAAGAIGEIIGAVAVVGTLVYLALQIRMQNKEARLAANQDLQRSVREISDSLRTDPEMLQIYLDAVSNKMDQFNALDAARLSLFFQSNFRIMEGAFYQHQANQLDARLWEP